MKLFSLFVKKNNFEIVLFLLYIFYMVWFVLFIDFLGLEVIEKDWKVVYKI